MRKGCQFVDSLEAIESIKRKEKVPLQEKRETFCGSTLIELKGEKK
jgi:hypothetical protein